MCLLSSQSFAADGLRWGASTWDHARILPEGKTVLEVRGQVAESQSLSSDSAQASRQGMGELSYKQRLGAMLKANGSDQTI